MPSARMLALLVALALALSACASDGSETSAVDATEANAEATLVTDAQTPNPSGFWKPPPGTTWQWQLDGDIDTSFDVAVYDIDLFDAPESIIDTLHAQGRTVICYFSAGSREEGREDADQFTDDDYDKRLEDWPRERWLDVRSQNVRRIMEQRLDLALAKDCDAVEPDNVDGFQNDSGFPLTAEDQLDYNRFLADAAHARGLSVGLKNALDLVPELEPEFDWALNEECLAYEECEALAPFLAAGKAVFHVEYVDDSADGPALQAEVCDDPSIAGFSTLIKTYDLEAWRLTCDEREESP